MLVSLKTPVPSTLYYFQWRRSPAAKHQFISLSIMKKLSRNVSFAPPINTETNLCTMFHRFNLHLLTLSLANSWLIYISGSDCEVLLCVRQWSSDWPADCGTSCSRSLGIEQYRHYSTLAPCLTCCVIAHQQQLPAGQPAVVTQLVLSGGKGGGALVTSNIQLRGNEP